MVVFDIFANLSMIIMFCLAFPSKVFKDELICIAVGVVRAMVSVTNRYDLKCISKVKKLIKVTIFSFRVIPWVSIIYRVLMVCYSDFCRNYGEQTIRNKLLMVPILIPILHTLCFIYHRRQARNVLK